MASDASEAAITMSASPAASWSELTVQMSAA